VVLRVEPYLRPALVAEPGDFASTNSKVDLELVNLPALPFGTPSSRRFLSPAPVFKTLLETAVLGTTNAPYRRSIRAKELVDALTFGESGQWTVHVATFFTDVRPELVLRFAKLHGIPTRELASAYGGVKEATGEANPALENLLEQLAPIT